jgi:16S rRNA (uracil1498-N3)-methyltransferase
VLLILGPEGGWARAELSAAFNRGARPLYLGPRTLRAETAPIVALTVLWTIFGWT